MVRFPSRLLVTLRQAFGPSARAAIAQASRRRLSGLVRAFAAAPPVAHLRGVQLLRENLSAEQREQHEKKGYFDVLGGQTGRRYRIRNGAQMNVLVLDESGTPAGKLCFAPQGKLPVGDVMLAQKLALELFELDALKIANKFPGR